MEIPYIATTGRFIPAEEIAAAILATAPAPTALASARERIAQVVDAIRRNRCRLPHLRSASH
jgi:hypothetical protein